MSLQEIYENRITINVPRYAESKIDISPPFTDIGDFSAHICAWLFYLNNLCESLRRCEDIRMTYDAI